MSKLYIMCGLPGSGKSTYAMQLAVKENAIVVSTDNIRELLNGDASIQDNAEQVFKIAHKLILKYLDDDSNVIFDATNISYKRRMELIKRYKKHADSIECVFIAVPYEVCLERNQKRDRKVPEEVIERMYHNFYVPQLFEGFDKIITVIDKEHYYYYKMPKDIPQDNPHHTLTILEHCKKAYFNICEFTDNYILKQAALFHDIGKFKTKKFKDKRGNDTDIAHYYNHENIGAYDIFFYCTPAVITLEDVSKISMYIQWHMLPYITMSYKKIKYYDKLLGEEIINNIYLINKADMAAK